MNKIKAPIRLNMRRNVVAELHVALSAVGRELGSSELADRRFGRTTREAVRDLQLEFGLRATGVVDEATAERLNELLKEHGAFDRQSRSPDATGLRGRHGRPAAIVVPSKDPTRREVRSLHEALVRVGLEVDADDFRARQLGEGTVAAIKELQRRDGLSATGKLNVKTLALINAELEHAHFTGKRARTARIHEMLGRLEFEIDDAERESRSFGESTKQAVVAFRDGAGFSAKARIDAPVFDALESAALTKFLSSKRQTSMAQRKLLSVLAPTGIQARISPKELKAKKMGPTTRKVVKEFQAKFGLAQTGELDPVTWERINSALAGRFQRKKLLSVTAPSELKRLTKTLRLNMSNSQVRGLQKNLAFHGFRIDQREYSNSVFGGSTRKAVLAFQKREGLELTGHADKATTKSLNVLGAFVNPTIAAAEGAHHVRGTVRNERWKGAGGVKVEVFETTLRGQDVKLSERRSGSNGFFDVPYNPPVNAIDGQVKDRYQLRVQVTNDAGDILLNKVLLRPTSISWVNFTEGGAAYLGDSEYARLMRKVNGVLKAGEHVADLVEGKFINVDGASVETDPARELTHVSLHTALAIDDVMSLVLAHRCANHLGHGKVGPAVFFAFIRQNQPSNLPGDPLSATVGWTLIDELVEQTVSGVVFMNGEAHEDALQGAKYANLVPIEVWLDRAETLAALAEKREAFTLTKPLLVGNGNLKALLDTSSVENVHYGAVAQAFLKHQNLDETFWADVKSRPAEFGDAARLDDLQESVQLGHVSKNHLPVIGHLKAALADPNEAKFMRLSDVAKLSKADWTGVLSDAGIAPPVGTDGNDDNERREVYATTLGEQSARLFPSIALTAEVQRESGDVGLDHLDGVATLLDENSELDLGKINVDTYVKKHALVVAPEVIREARLVQRVQRIAPEPAAGRAVIESRLHESRQIVALGKERFVMMLDTKGIPPRLAATVFGRAEFQYAQVLAMLAKYRFELYRVNTKVIVDYTYGTDEFKNLMGDMPDLATLFGPQDFCDCKHCNSMNGPAAYFTDLLRFLNEQPAETGNESARDVLFRRRPDLGNIKLNCDNALTPMPYVDLVCEVLERAVPIPATDPDFKLQTTRTAKELRAAPEHVRYEAYAVLRDADWPIDSGFDLWQEESRLLLKHLGIERSHLMWLFQARPEGGTPVPSEASTAGEFFGISSHETSLIITSAPTSAAQDEFWSSDLDTSLATVGVVDFIDHAHISYSELLALRNVLWISANPPAAPVAIGRLGGSCDLAKQTVQRLTPARFDRIHRFLRFWRHSNHEMWQLDLLLRAPGIGADALDGATLAATHHFAHVQSRLGLDFETCLALFGEINTEERSEPADATRKIAPLYVRLFQNPSITNPVDLALASAALAGTLSAKREPIAAALHVSANDLKLLIAYVGDVLDLAHLSRVYALATLGRALKLPVTEFLLLLDLQDDERPPAPGRAAGRAGDVFRSPAALWKFIELHEEVRASHLSVLDLDYVLEHRSAAAQGLRDETVGELLAAMRDRLRSVDPTERDGEVISHVATSFSLRDEQAAALLSRVSLNGTTLLVNLVPAALIARDENDDWANDIDKATFGPLFSAFALLHKASLLVNRHGIDEVDDLEWLLTSGPALGLLSFGDLPVDAAPAASLLPGWLSLSRWMALRGSLPQPEGSTLSSVFDLAAAGGAELATVAEMHATISALTQWPQDDLATLHAELGLQHDAAKSSYVQVETWQRLTLCFSALNRLGITAAQAALWARRSAGGGVPAQALEQIRLAAKAKYDHDTWLEKLAPLQDVLRDKKRAALVAYLIEHSLRNEKPEVPIDGKDWKNPAYWKRADDLLNYYLLDVKMSSCQLTSRIKRATGSVRDFVQRCFLNLEQPRVEVSREEKEDVVSMNSWRQWQWMKNYRVWEANRKVYLYPENWIEPELRDDKSPFFKEMENELLSGEVTHESAERAMSSYLEKLDEVAHLEVVGTYHEVDDDNLDDDLPASIDRLHVIGRTAADPAEYYYRYLDRSYNRWTAWEKIEVEITGDHIMPVVYNRRLYLFWLVFTENVQKAEKQAVPDLSTPGNQDSPQPTMMLELQLAWSKRVDNGWTSKRVSKERLVHPWPRPVHSYHIKPRYKQRENHLWLDVYISTSIAFNDGQFWDAYKGHYDRLTKTYFSEDVRPWHSSSFVFDGSVRDVRLKGLKGKYHIKNADGIPANSAIDTDSYTYVLANFDESAGHTRRLNGPYQIAPSLAMPDGMHYRNNLLVNDVRDRNETKLNVLEFGVTKTLATGADDPFSLVFSQDDIRFDTMTWGSTPIVYQDRTRSYVIQPQWREILLGYNQTVRQLKYEFVPFYHPYSSLFLRELKRGGLDMLMKRRLQRFPHTFYPANSFDFNAEYSPVAPNAPDETAKKDRLDFSPYGAYAIYNWEVFFHAPMLIACSLSQNQRFEEAMRWFHYIFDPTSVDGLESPQRFWNTLPFYETNDAAYRAQRITNLLENLGVDNDAVREWKNDPFRPHLIARQRPVAYQKAIVMKYIDNLIEWGDQLFRRDSMESVDEATTLYVLALEILGKRPVKVPAAKREERSYNELSGEGILDPMANLSVTGVLEGFVDPPTRAVATSEDGEPLPQINLLYFCIPPNDKLTDYWDTIEDRLFKIRHCMNIRGVVRQLPLFEPPIDPALLVKAAAAGVDIGSVLNDMGAPKTEFRFERLMAAARDFNNDVRSLGQQLLSVLERRDGEEVAQLRANHEQQLLKSSVAVRKSQINEAKEAEASIRHASIMVDIRHDWYSDRDYMNTAEIASMVLAGGSIGIDTGIAISMMLASVLKFVPRVNVGGSGAGGSPVVTATVVDGDNLGSAASNMAGAFAAVSGVLQKLSGLASTVGSFERRQDEWNHQSELTAEEQKQRERDIAAAEIRVAIAEKELTNLEEQIDRAKTVEAWMKDKYTNERLYEWMVRQLSSVYFATYKLAYDMARRAERSLQYELGRPELSFIEFGYWDSLKKGLVAGDRLGKDLRLLESAWIDERKRELEFTKHISLARVRPLSLLTLKTTGECTVTLPEWLFDMDYPGHYKRRIKSVALSIPAVVGPYVNINCTLSLTNHGTRVSESIAGGYGDPLAAADPRFTKVSVPIQSMATSHGQNDSGLFELRFENERFLPFEGAGAVSEWRLELPPESNQFDFDTISDVILHVRYTAQASTGLMLKDEATKNLNLILPTAGARLISIRNEFSDAWFRFLEPVGDVDQELSIVIGRDDLPFYVRKKAVAVTSVAVVIEDAKFDQFEVQVTTPGGTFTGPATEDGIYGKARHFKAATLGKPNALGSWKLKLREAGGADWRSLAESDLGAVYLIITFELS